MQTLRLPEQTWRIQDRLTLKYIRRAGYQKTYAMITFPIGGLHRHVIKDGKHVPIPAGAAHFLEHKCFEDDGAELTAVFAQQGASVNAFTSPFQTSYLFETTEQVLANIKTLLKLVFFPNFTPEGVDNEKGIITEEWASSQDNPFYTQYHTLLETLYEDHPFSTDIIGTKESINAMDYDTLSMIHQAVYQPEHATLIISGDLDMAPIVNALSGLDLFPQPSSVTPASIKGAKPPVIKAPTISVDGDVYASYWLQGYRLDLTFDSPEARLKYYLALEIGCDMLFDQTSPWVETMQDQGVINDSFDVDLTLYPEVALILISTQVKDPEVTKQAVDAQFKNREGLTEARFEMQKKANIGSFIYGLDSLQGTVRNTAFYLMDGVTPYDLLDMQMTMTLEDVLDALTQFHASYMKADVILNPRA